MKISGSGKSHYKLFHQVFIISAAALLLVAVGCSPQAETASGPKAIAVLSDTHLPGRNLPAKERAIADIRGWEDIDLVVVTGDIVATSGTQDQYDFAKAFLDRCGKPLRVVGGNHEYLYSDDYPIDPETGHHLKETSPEARSEKLERFRRTWDLESHYWTETLGGYRLVFLTPDGLESNDYAEMAPEQVEWLEATLRSHRDDPTIVFFHAPLKGTYASRRFYDTTTTDSYDAEPATRIDEILKANPQVFIWVAGHLHIAPTNPDFNSPVNLYDGRVTVIHNTDWNGSSATAVEDVQASSHEAIWTNTLRLYPDHVEVRTYDHSTGQWLPEHNRSIQRPDET